MTTTASASAWHRALAPTDAPCTLDTAADWLELRLDGRAHPLAFTPAQGSLRAVCEGVEVQVQGSDAQGDPSAHRVLITVHNSSSRERRVNLKWTLRLARRDRSPRWLLPALIYKDTVQHYPGFHPSLIGQDLALMRGPCWTFRSDLLAVPMVMAWTDSGSLAMVIDERIAGHMTGVGLDDRPGHVALIGSWPYREEPRRRENSRHVPDVLSPVIEEALLAPRATVTITFDLFAGSTDPQAYAPILRRTFERLDPLHPTVPRSTMRQAAASAAFGLMQFHYDPAHRALWETAAWEEYYGKGGTYVDRFEMHVAFTSGIPYAYAMLDLGLAHRDEALIAAGRNVIDHCCEGRAPCGLLWSVYHRDHGWATGWPSPQRARGSVTMDGRTHGDLQARTQADATIFTCLAAQRDPEAPHAQAWRDAVRSSLDFVLQVQRPDGNPGQAYRPDGTVLDWDGEEGLMWIGALAQGYRLLGEKKYLDAARRAAAYHLPMVEDGYLTGAPEGMHRLPTSEDPQNAVIAYTQLYDTDPDPRWLRAARWAADLLMTYRWQYNTHFPPDTLLERYAFATKGMDISSPNNSHLHPFGLIAVPELVRLWDLTGDAYLLRQTRNNLHACTQVMCWADGVYNGRRGMSTERFVQSDFGMRKGSIMQLAHAWTTGCVLYACAFVESAASVCIDEASGTAVALEAVELTCEQGRHTVRNPWPEAVRLTVRRRSASGVIHRSTLTLEPRGGIVTLT